MSETQRVGDLLADRIDGDIESVVWYRSSGSARYALVGSLTDDGRAWLSTVLLDVDDETLRVLDNSIWIPAEPGILDAAIRSLARTSNAANGAIDDPEPMAESQLDIDAESFENFRISDDYDPNADDGPWQATNGPDEMNAVHTLLTDSPVDNPDRLIRLEFGQKDPWSGENQRVMRSPDEIGGNYGVEVGEDDDLVILDVDDLEAAPLEDMPETLRSVSPHDGEHRFYHVPGWQEHFQERYGVDNPHTEWGEVRAGDGYVVGPGSELTECKHDDCCTESDPGEYELDTAPIATVDAETIGDLLATGREEIDS